MTPVRQPFSPTSLPRLAVRNSLALLAVLFLFGAASSLASQPIGSTAVVEQYLSAWQAGDTGRMYELLDNEAKKTVGPQEFAEAFTVRLPYTDKAYVIRPVRFSRVRLRPDAHGVVDYQIVFTVESLLGPAACSIFCREMRDSLAVPEARIARKQGLYLIYDQAKPNSHYLNISYVLGVWGLVVIQDVLSPSPSQAPTNPPLVALPSVGLEADSELVMDTASLEVGPVQISSASRPLRLTALEVRPDRRLNSLVAAPPQKPLSEWRLTERDFYRLMLLMGLDH